MPDYGPRHPHADGPRTRPYDAAFAAEMRRGAAGKAVAELVSLSALELSGKRR
jgi:hypothetical protein